MSMYCQAGCEQGGIRAQHRSSHPLLAKPVSTVPLYHVKSQTDARTAALCLWSTLLITLPGAFIFSAVSPLSTQV